MKYDKMVECSLERSKQKVETAKREIQEMLESKEKITVAALIQKTGFSKGFFYRNEEMRRVVNEAMHQQSVTYNPKQIIIDMAKELDQMLESEKGELPAENNPLADIVDIQAQALLNLVSPEGFTLSSKAVKSEETVSNRKLRQGYGTMKEKDNGAGDTIFFNLYLIDKFGNAANKKKNTVLDYEMEYLLGGKASDKDNLEYVIGRIRILRFAVNYGYLLTDKDMQMEVDTLATTLSAVFLSPEIGPVIKHALLLAWAYGESLTDVKTLLAGKKVPAVKSKESWNLTLDGLLELAKNRSIPEGKETEEGNSYEQYLQMMLVLKSKEELSMRALDLVEMNLRSGMEKTFFRADACVSGADFDMTCYLRRGIRYQYHILYQYQ